MELLKHFIVIRGKFTNCISTKICGLTQGRKICDFSHEIWHYVDNKLHGLYYLIVDNGGTHYSIVQITNYKYGKKNGIELYWMESLFASKENYIDDKLHGTCYYWNCINDILSVVYHKYQSISILSKPKPKRKILKNN